MLVLPSLATELPVAGLGFGEGGCSTTYTGAIEILKSFERDVCGWVCVTHDLLRAFYGRILSYIIIITYPIYSGIDDMMF